MSLRKDPAEHSSYLRLFYRGWRPTLLGRVWTRVLAWICGLGLLPGVLISLRTTDPRSGRLHAHILVAATHEGELYLVSMLGDRSNWVQDVRATGSAALIRHGRRLPVVLTEISPDQRAPILKAWCHVAPSGRRHLPVAYDAPVSAFEAIASDYPVFRIDPMPQLAGAAHQ